MNPGRIGTYHFSRVLPPHHLDFDACDWPGVFDFVGRGVTEYDYHGAMFSGPMFLMSDIFENPAGDPE